ncbi:Ig-like domain-containing protein [Nicoliella spurrieriana]|uniref:Ig-like domain-containing protein n=1 Tax=Nicoliella spurrieriana TaxID=2925830 RepID=A0A976X5Z4_9LACO|nr:Ig-like domain-containing protein [Nicoliella spurrieriana]UQS87179.1 Ig-like domain-containing protein [Nicoliella spurrieriana]
MKKPFLFVIGAFFLALFSFGTSANAATSATKTPSLSVPSVTTADTKISGTATKNVDVYVRLNNNKKIAATVANSKGKYTITLPKKYAVNTKLYVYAQPDKSSHYFYRIVTVKAASTTTTTNTSSSAKTTNKSSSNNSSSSSVAVAKVNDLMGNWKSSASGSYTQLWTFNNDTGLNQTLYKNKILNSKLLSNAVFNVKHVNGKVITLTYRGKGDKKTSTMYIRLVNKNKFYLVDSNNKLVSVKMGAAPAATYSFTRIK